MPRHYRNYTDKELINAVESSISIAGVIRALGLVCAGGNYQTVKLAIARLQLDCTHFKGSEWNKGSFTKPLSLKRSTTSIKKHLIHLRGHCCENCNLTEWLNDPIPLELEHINGNSLDHSEKNLLLLCPNCHAKTTTYRRCKSSL